MKTSTKIIFSVAISLLLGTLQLQAQWYAMFVGDMVELYVGGDGVTGSVQWQQTDDTTGAWVNIPGGTTATYIHTTQASATGFKFYRAEINNLPVCDISWYSPIIKHRIVSSFSEIQLGDFFSGGYVFYSSNDSLLLAAPFDQSAGVQWGCNGTAITGAGESVLGTGYFNTKDIVAECAVSAAYICDTLSYLTCTDWFLPSINELEAMYQALQQNGLGNFTNDYYWSSTQSDADNAWYKYFENGSQ